MKCIYLKIGENSTKNAMIAFKSENPINIIGFSGWFFGYNNADYCCNL